MNVQFLKSAQKVEQCPPPSLPEFAVVGRSNAGKSSLLNAIVD
jgi:GTP-binding protein